MENCGSAVINVIGFCTWPSDQPRHATHTSNYPVDTRSPPFPPIHPFTPTTFDYKPAARQGQEGRRGNAAPQLRPWSQDEALAAVGCNSPCRKPHAPSILL